MQYATAVSGTFGGECLSLAACSSTLDCYERNPVIAWLWARGQQLMDGFNALAPSIATLEGAACKPHLTFHDDPTHLHMSLFLQETAKRGLLIHPTGFTPMWAHTEADVTSTIEACGAAFAAIKDGVKLEGAICHPVQIR